MVSAPASPVLVRVRCCTLKMVSWDRLPSWKALKFKCSMKLMPSIWNLPARPKPFVRVDLCPEPHGLSYRCPAPMVPFRPSESMALFQFVQLAIDLVKERKEAADQPGPFRPGLAPHLAVGDVAPFPFQIFGPGGLYPQDLTDSL